MKKEEMINLLKSLNVKSESKIEEYVNYCLERKYNIYVHSETAHHHILPKEKFPEFESLKLHPWNGVHLAYEEHTEAHKILHEAIRCYKLAYAYVTCSIISNNYKDNPDWQNTKINAWKEWANDTDDDGLRNIDKSIRKGMKTKEENGTYDEWGKYMSNFLNEVIDTPEGPMSRAKIQTKKGLETKRNTILENGRSILENMADKRSEWRKKEVILEDGTISNNQKEAVAKGLETKRNTILENGRSILENMADKISLSLKKKVVDEHTGELVSKGYINTRKAQKELDKQLDTKMVIYKNEEMTLREARNKKISDTIKEKSQKYRIIGVNSPEGEFTHGEIASFTISLFKTDQNTPLGSDQKSMIQLKKYKKLHMIGWFIEKVTSKD